MKFDDSAFRWRGEVDENLEEERYQAEQAWLKSREQERQENGKSGIPQDVVYLLAGVFIGLIALVALAAGYEALVRLGVL